MKVTFSIEYRTGWGENLELVTGEDRHPMCWSEGDIWTVTIDGMDAGALMHYGYVVVRDGIILRSEWEDHSFDATHAEVLEIRDRWLECPVQGCPFTRKHSAAIFDRPGFRGAGTAVPVFSLRTEEDFGIGDFRDLRPLVEWAAATGQTIIQLLPINDTTRRGGWEDSYPYSPISSFALHPLYLRLQDIGVPSDDIFLKKRSELNALPELDYPRVFSEKMALIRQAYRAGGTADLSSTSFRTFCEANSYWLDEYAAFCAGRDGEPADFYRWMQFHLDRQLSEEVAYAHSRGVFLKGDLPIGVSADSADAHFHPELFNLDSSAGAPPDFFSADGQNWGFPTYNWETMASDGYAWWKERLRKMSEYFDAFRIDHILGFFRIWEIPAGEKSGVKGHFNPALPYCPEEIMSMGLPLEGLFHEDPRHTGMFQPLITPSEEGLESWQKEAFRRLYDDFFYHRHDSFWRDNAERKLPVLLRATGMLACGEDLGMVPDCVPEVMEKERILSLEMPMMDKGRPWPRLSVCATSSHDMAPLRAQQPADLPPEECFNVLSGVLSSDSMLAVFPIQDWLSIEGTLRRENPAEERINEPADPHHHWRYRLHIGLERLASDTAFVEKVAGMVSSSGRAL